MDDRAKVDCVANARALAPVIAAAVPRIEADRELPADLVDALHEARLWRMLLPRSYGGDGGSPVVYVQAIEEIAKADASASASCVLCFVACVCLAYVLCVPDSVFFSLFCRFSSRFFGFFFFFFFFF